jgi:hypothetical protein
MRSVFVKVVGMTFHSDSEKRESSCVPQQISADCTCLDGHEAWSPGQRADTFPLRKECQMPFRFSPIALRNVTCSLKC